MAEGFAKARNAPGIEVTSAGTAAGKLHPAAVKVMAEVGVDISGQRSKSLAQLESLDFDVAITMCEQAAEACPLLPGNPRTVAWNLPDPSAADGDETAVLSVFRKSRDEIRRLVDDLFDRGYLTALAEAQRCAFLILDNVSDGVIAHDMSRRIILFNKAAEDITGYRREEVLNRDCHEVFAGGFCREECRFLEKPARGVDSFRRQDMEITAKNGEKRSIVLSVRPMIDHLNRSVGAVSSFRDLTWRRSLARRVGETENFVGIVGRDPKMLEVYGMIRDLADSSVPVLIQGETGTGKELVAAAIHGSGPRSGKLFVPVNCGALPESLLESELFGHVKGAFTGAIRDKKGRFELADEGTIFLDEIGDITPAVQVKLLRVLQEGRFERVGGEETIQVNARVISATNKNLSKEIAAGRFREDLYYRLSVVPLTLPPLRERRGDIPLIAGYVLEKVLKDAHRERVTFSPEAVDVMVAHDWPGNVREMQNWIQFALVKTKGSLLLPEHFPPAGRTDVKPTLPTDSRRKLNVESVRAALREAEGSKVEAAKLLGVSRATLYRFLEDTGAAG